MHLDINEEVRKLKILGITPQNIQNELDYRDIPNQELRYFGSIPHYASEEKNPLEYYNTKQLQKIKEVMEMKTQTQTDNIVNFFEDSFEKCEKSTQELINRMKEMLADCKKLEDYQELYKTIANEYATTANIVNRFNEKLGNTTFGCLSEIHTEEIKNRLKECKTIRDCKENIWIVADLYITENEKALYLEDVFIKNFGEEAYGIFMFGSLEAYKKECEFNEKLSKATPEERYLLITEKIFNTPDKEEEVDLWAEDDIPNIEEDYQKAQ